MENKLSASSDALESLNKQMDDLSLKLDSAQETIKIRKFFLLVLDFRQTVDLKNWLVLFVCEVLNSNMKSLLQGIMS